MGVLMLMNFVFPYTMSNFIDPIKKCINTLEILDIDSVVSLFRLCGTDVLFMQDKYYGYVIPYNNITLTQDDIDDSESLETFITVFKTPWVDLVFNCIAEIFNLDVIYKTKMYVALAADNKCYTDSNLLDTITLFNKQGNISIDDISKCVLDFKDQITNDTLNKSTLYWGNTFGYTIAPLATMNKYDTIKKNIFFDFKYADV